jgi:fatty-acyl-CoA synthase
MNDWRHLTFAKALDKIVSSYGNNEALVYQNERLTYKEFQQRVDRLSKGLMALGVKQGDRVAVFLPNFPEWIIAQWAIAQIGSVLVSINPRHRAHDVEYAMNNAEVETLILADQFKKVNFLNILEQCCPEIKQMPRGSLKCGKIPSLRNIIFVRSRDYPCGYSLEDVMKRGDSIPHSDLARRKDSHGPDDMVYLLYTSGTTSFPKGAVRTHDNILQHGFDVGTYQNTTPQDRVLAVIPLCGAWGVSTLIPATLLHGACLVLLDDFDAEETLRVIQDEKITLMHGVDVMFRAMIDFPGRRKCDISTLKKGGVALFSSGTEIMKEIIHDLGMTYAAQALGMTELNACWLMSKWSDPEEMRINTIGGWVMPGLQCVLKDPLTKQVLPPGQVGELCVKGFTVLREYYRSPEETKNAFDQDGWFHTGDLGICDGDIHYCFKGRLKEMYKSQGFNVTPREVEEFLQAHPKIQAVGVVGVPHPESGETGMAFIEVAPGVKTTVQEILEYCRGKIASYKIPKFIIFVDRLPRVQGPHGDKISKPQLAELARQELSRRKGN